MSEKVILAVPYSAVSAFGLWLIIDVDGWFASVVGLVLMFFAGAGLAGMAKFGSIDRAVNYQKDGGTELDTLKIHRDASESLMLEDSLPKHQKYLDKFGLNVEHLNIFPAHVSAISIYRMLTGKSPSSISPPEHLCLFLTQVWETNTEYHGNPRLYGAMFHCLPALSKFKGSEEIEDYLCKKIITEYTDGQDTDWIKTR